MVKGGGVCHMHGGKAPQVARKRAERVALAEAMAAGDRRDPALILLDCLHAADTVMRQALASPGSATPGELAVVVDHLDRASKFARSVLDLRLAERRVQITERQVDTLELVLRQALERSGLSVADRRRVLDQVPVVLGELAAGASS